MEIICNSQYLIIIAVTDKFKLFIQFYSRNIFLAKPFIISKKALPGKYLIRKDQSFRIEVICNIKYRVLHIIYHLV